eukprot:COSAG05_NODE_624_length_8276_cov_4.903265_9_plen_96_part_00
MRLAQRVLVEAGLVEAQLLEPAPNPFLCPRNEKSAEAGYQPCPYLPLGFTYVSIARKIAYIVLMTDPMHDVGAPCRRLGPLSYALFRATSVSFVL